MLGKIETIASFYSEKLGNSRDICIYLPPGYDDRSEAAYPVLYVHDGQNVFEPAFNGQCWNLHTVCERLIAEQRIEPLIIVAVANRGAERNSEFAHYGEYSDKLDYECMGESYEFFLIEELKPYIDAHYRTRRESGHTALMGSSRGGLVTYHIGFRRPDVFGKLIMFSPYFAQWNEQEMTHIPIIHKPNKKENLQMWIDTGGMEGMTVLVSHVREMVDRLLDIGYRSGEDLMFCYEPMAEHNESAWQSRVHAPLIYCFGNIGQPVSVQLIGEEAAGVSGSASYLYPIIRYESGLDIVDMDARYTVCPTDAAEVTSRGHIQAYKPGECSIAYCSLDGSLSAHHRLAIVPSLPDRVVVDIEVAVPEDTGAGCKVYAGIELEAAEQGLYRRRVKLPRGTGYSFHICEYSGKQEADAAGDPTPKRQFIASTDLVLRYEVQSWIEGHSL